LVFGVHEEIFEGDYVFIAIEFGFEFSELIHGFLTLLFVIEVELFEEKLFVGFVMQQKGDVLC
jgi:hypothetical protein